MENRSRKNPLSFIVDPRNEGEIRDCKFYETDG